MPEPSAQFAHVSDDVHGDGFTSAKYDAAGIGYSLSGGGYKAAAFHLGGLTRLNELGLLPKISRIASVSGGSIAAGFLGKVWDDPKAPLQFDANGVATNFKNVFSGPFEDFLTEVDLDISKGIFGLLDPFESAADKISEGYAKYLTGDATLQDLPDDTKPGKPRFTLLATNYELNSLWRFSRLYAADYRVGRIEAPDFKLSDIIAASSAFPPFFCPLELSLKNQKWGKQDGTDCHSGDFLKRALLCDGGIYDNMGLEPIWKRYGTLLVSNAGDPFNEADAPGNWGSMLRRILSMVHRQAENNRVRTLMMMAVTQKRKVAYWPLRNDNSNYPNPSPLSLSASDIHDAQTEPVRLAALKPKAFRRLANHGYILADSATRSYLGLGQVPPAQLPF